MAVLQNSEEALRKLDDLGFITYEEPLWLNLSHHDARELQLLPAFLERIRSVDEIVDVDDPAYDGLLFPEYVYVPKPKQRIPVTEVNIPIHHSLDRSLDVSFVATARPVVEDEVSLSFGAKPTLERLVVSMMQMGKNEMFAPHLSGVCGSYDGDMILFYPLRFRTARQEEFLKLIAHGLEDRNYDQLIIRDPKVTLANRVKYPLCDLVAHGFLASNKDFRRSACCYEHFETRVRNAKFDAVKQRRLRGAMRQVHFSELAGHYRLLREDLADDHVATYYPLTMHNFGEDFDWDEACYRTQTLPVALATLNGSDGNKGIFNYGLFVRFNRSGKRNGELQFAYWGSKRFVERTSQAIADRLRLLVTPVYKPLGRKA
ncbi:hypothetical protein GF367_01125, partial [Candidatus Woesearchaeota archaeon]|nr:hypothetical protein [Candidatus Woesearchaeota archaeon]